MLDPSHSVEARAPSGLVNILSGMEVGVVGVAATLTHRRAAGTAIDDYAELISDCTPLRAVRLPMRNCDTRTVVSNILDLPWPVSAVFVVGLGHSASATVQRRVADQCGPLVITELDLISIALAAAAIGTLRVLGIASRQGRIVVTNPERASRLGPTILAASGGVVTGWHERDSASYPLCRVMYHNDVLIDLAGTVPSSVAPGRILTPPDAGFDYGALVLPGLLSALCGRGEARLTLDTLASCVRALARLTPPGDVLPAPDQQQLIPAIAQLVARTLTLPPTRQVPATPTHRRQCLTDLPTSTSRRSAP